ncbi:hypothetical protein LJB85_01725 [Porphyromonadaceae bacterium OttesenSCG-928-L07]|nr:hypothetical protein [Porphyromonadaceae bacterium OttesenSCG-928-L07]MDL2251235.1 hypothetical protein [Odoribacter sp. OttesenSCG-928-J03]
MEVKPVNNSRQPNYPTIELFVKHPELLSRNIPNNWLKNQFVATSFAAFLLSGCGTTVAAPPIQLVVAEQESLNASQKEKTDNNIVTNIAPVFAHGEGRGAIGCIVMSPPVFISEDEAITIILDKLKSEGYNFSRENSPTLSFEVAPIANECDEPKGKVKIELEMDAYNSNSKWAIQFISTGDYNKFKNDNCWSTVSGFDLKKAAEIINQELKNQKETNAVVFYNPLPLVDFDKYDDWQIGDKEEMKKAKDLLLAQVTDFINWLKENNITIE